MGALAIIAGIGIGIGGIIKTVGDVQKAQAQAKEDERKAKQLKELSKPGGYYDQELTALRLDLQDVEADRAAAGKILAISSLDITRQGASISGQITAQAGAGNISSSSGSVVKRQDLVKQTVEENLAKTRLQYEDQLRGLATRAAQDTAQKTAIKFKKKTGLSDAEALKSEADWLSTWGVGLGIAGGIVGTVTGMASLGASLGLGVEATVNPSPTIDPYSLVGNVSYSTPGASAPPYWTEY